MSFQVKNNNQFFFWNPNVILLTISSLACNISNKGNLTSLSVQQRLTISTGSSPNLSIDTSVDASNKEGSWFAAKTLRITENKAK